MNTRLAARWGGGVVYVGLLLVASLTTNAAVPTPAQAQPPDSGLACLRQWPNDRETYLLCQQLQTRNHMAFRQFLTDHGIKENDLFSGRGPDTPIARAAKYCIDHYSPDYQSIWSCTQRRTESDRKN
ncbi:hypothetical protein [Salinisphaera hydrothermalis]|uniref:hypothetical protein n=1 Tax=Salinisphaera hydrothermalis TaxID=563188 RepID=UPI0012EB876F|nr:hypothetical protein [Salinisphaera hydrothermalis]